MGFYGLFASVFAVTLLFTGIGAYYKGRESREPEIVELTSAITAAKQAAIDAENRARVVVERVVTVYKDKIKTVTERLPGEIQLIEVIKRETPDSCLLPPAYRELWDGAAAPRSANAEGAPGVNGAPVAVADAAATAAEARRRFDKNAAKLEALQEIIRSQ